MTHFDITDHIRIDELSPFNYTSRRTINNLEDFLKSSVSRISTETNPRIIILETWLMLDFAIRQLIVWGIGADINSNDNFDLRSELLPTGFQNCLDFLITYKKRQENLTIDPNEKCLRLPVRFWYYLNKELDKPDSDIVINTIYKYQKKMNPNFQTPQEIVTSFRTPVWNISTIESTSNTTVEYRTVDEHWLKVTSHLNEDWVKKVTQINKARNIAAHSYNEEIIFSAFGINGSNKIELLRNKCVESISSLLKVKFIK